MAFEETFALLLYVFSFYANAVAVTAVHYILQVGYMTSNVELTPMYT